MGAIAFPGPINRAHGALLRGLDMLPDVMGQAGHTTGRHWPRIPANSAKALAGPAPAPGYNPSAARSGRSDRAGTARPLPKAQRP